MKVPAQSLPIRHQESPAVSKSAPAVVENADGDDATPAPAGTAFDGTVSSSRDDGLRNFVAEQRKPALTEKAATSKTQPETAEVSPQQRQVMRDQFEAARDGLRWSREESVLPLGVRYERVPLGHEGGADGYTFTALVPSGALVPGSVPPKSADDEGSQFFVERSGGLAGTTRVAGPIALAD